MQGSRVVADNEVSRKVELFLPNEAFDFVTKLKVGEKGFMSIDGIVSSIFMDGENIKRNVSIVDAKLNKAIRIK
jgi:hypothetical protein